MKLIIELDDDIAKGMRGENECEVEPREIVRSFQATIADAIANGIPLPKGHGRLIDVDALREDFKTSKKITFAELMNISCIVDHASIIVEADKENENE